MSLEAKMNGHEKSWVIGIIGIVIGILIQFGAGVYWAGRLSESIGSIEQRVARVEGEISAGSQGEIAKAERFTKLEERTADIQDKITDLKTRIADLANRSELNRQILENWLKKNGKLN